ncbi:FAD/NAD(P)-binding protein [Xenorhabdus stockiae]|uniref:FAD/NAD(P)-binding protein n=1 Tax=Xenorhabdus stockiae TaxID=351614 RepID=UPI0040628B00
MNTITIIGSGPRGMSVLERLVTRLNDNPGKYNLDIILVDYHKIGQGRIWDSSQSENYIMNTLSTEISAFSGHGSIDEARPGYGPSFAEWWRNEFNDFEKYQGYAPRKYYGKYLEFVYKTIKKHLPIGIKLIERNDLIIDIEKDNGGYYVVSKNHLKWKSNAIILTTGHSKNEYSDKINKLSNFTERNSEIKFFGDGYASEMVLSSIKPNESVGVIGLGLSFFDIISELTEGRGGQFIEKNGDFIYLPSKLEPNLYCGSRSGLPILARGKNEKSSNYKHEHRIFTISKVKKLRSRRKNNLDFIEDIWKLLEAEVNYVYFNQIIINEIGINSSKTFTSAIVNENIEDSEKLSLIASEILGREVLSLNLKTLARPFSKKNFTNIEEWENSLISLLSDDLSEAESGNISSPLKSALDVLRNSRDNIRAAVDFGGLSPNDHKLFLYEYLPIITLLSAGPPLFRIKQLIALIKAGVVTIVPPNMDISYNDKTYILCSDAVNHYQQPVTTLIDARIPTVSLQTDKNPLIKNLFNKGIFSPFVNHGDNNLAFVTGGVNVTTSPFHPIGADNEIHHNLFVLGIPTEHTRWFMQSGSSRPSHWIDFMIDADSIANSALEIIN